MGSSYYDSDDDNEDMITSGDIEVKKDTPKEKEVHWTNPNFSSLYKDSYYNAPIFTFLNVRWYLRFDPTETENEDYVALFLKMDNVGLAFNMLCTFGIKKADDSLVEIISLKHIFCDQNLKLIARRFSTRSALWQSDSELVPLNKLTIVCNLRELPYPTKLMELNLLSEDIKSLITDGEFCDITLHVKGREFKAHKIILAARSPVFASYFKHETSEKQNGVINIPDCDPDSFPEFLEYLYSGKLENISFNKVLHLYKTANKYDILALKLFCIENMEHNLDMDHFYDVLSLAELHDDTNLFNAAQEFFNKNLHEIFATAEWKNLMTNNSNLANKLLLEMSSDVQVVSKRRRLH